MSLSGESWQNHCKRHLHRHQHHDYLHQDIQHCRLPGTCEATDGSVECSDEVLHIREPFWQTFKAVTNRLLVIDLPIDY